MFIISRDPLGIFCQPPSKQSACYCSHIAHQLLPISFPPRARTVRPAVARAAHSERCPLRLLHRGQAERAMRRRGPALGAFRLRGVGRRLAAGELRAGPLPPVVCKIALRLPRAADVLTRRHLEKENAGKTKNSHLTLIAHRSSLIANPSSLAQCLPMCGLELCLRTRFCSFPTKPSLLPPNPKQKHRIQPSLFTLEGYL